MKHTTLPIIEVEAIAVTRLLLGVGIGLLVSHLVDARPRRWLGWVLVGVGVASTPPLICDTYRRRSSS